MKFKGEKLTTMTYTEKARRKVRITRALAVLRTALVSALLVISSAVVIAPAMAAGPPAAGGNQVVRIAEDSELVNFALTLPLKDNDGLDKALKDMYDPESPNYRHFLSSAEFNSKYGPSEASYAALKSFAVASDLTITGEWAGRTLLDVVGNVATIRSLFKTQMHWRQTSDGKQYFAPDREPSLPSLLLALGGNAAGLNQKPLIRVKGPGARPVPEPTSAGTGSSGSYAPADIKTAYNLNSIQNGGQPVALVEFSSANYNDANTYATKFNLNNPTLIQVSVDGGPNTSAGATEVMLDIEMVMAVSNPTTMYIYTGPNNTGNPNTYWGNVLHLYNKIAQDNLVGQVSASWLTDAKRQ